MVNVDRIGTCYTLSDVADDVAAIIQTACCQADCVRTATNGNACVVQHGIACCNAVYHQVFGRSNGVNGLAVCTNCFSHFNIVTCFNFGFGGGCSFVQLGNIHRISVSGTCGNIGNRCACCIYTCCGDAWSTCDAKTIGVNGGIACCHAVYHQVFGRGNGVNGLAVCTSRFGHFNIVTCFNFGFGGGNRIMNICCTCAADIAHGDITGIVYGSITAQHVHGRICNLINHFISRIQLTAVNRIGAGGCNCTRCNIDNLTLFTGSTHTRHA